MPVRMHARSRHHTRAYQATRIQPHIRASLKGRAEISFSSCTILSFLHDNVAAVFEVGDMAANLWHVLSECLHWSTLSADVCGYRFTRSNIACPACVQLKWRWHKLIHGGQSAEPLP